MKAYSNYTCMMDCERYVFNLLNRMTRTLTCHSVNTPGPVDTLLSFI